MEHSKDSLTDNPEATLKKVYGDNYPWLENYVRKNSGNAEDAQDIFQESVSIAWLNLKEGKFVGTAEQFNAYVRQVCKFKWINQLKSAVHTRTVLVDDPTALEGRLEETELLEEQLARCRQLNAAFAELGEKCKDLLGRFYYERQPLTQIAGAMDNTEESIKTIKYRCMMRLRKIYLEKYHSHE